MALACLFVLALAGGLAPPSAGAASVRGSLLQLTRDNASWPAERWQELFDRCAELGLEELVIQWSVADGIPFYTTVEPEENQLPVLGSILDRADAAGLEVLVGLIHDPGFEASVRRDVELVKVYLRRRRARSLRVAADLAGKLGEHPAFKGWYLPEEIDDVNWLDAERRSLLESHLADLASSLERLTPGATVAISGFSNAFADPEMLERLWRRLLLAAPIDRVLFQDGVGTGKQLIEDLPLYLAAVQRAVEATSGELQVIVELFEQTGGPPLDAGPFRARPAPVERVRRQLEAATPHAGAGLVLFTVTDYLDPRLGESADRLLLALHPSAREQGGARADARPRPDEPRAAVASISPPAPVPGPAPRSVRGAHPETDMAAGTGRRLIYELQLGLYYAHRDAVRAVELLASAERSPYIVEVESSQGETRYTVRIGTYRSMDEAVRIARDLRRSEDLDSVVRYRRTTARARGAAASAGSRRAGSVGRTVGAFPPMLR